MVAHVFSKNAVAKRLMAIWKQEHGVFSMELLSPEMGQSVTLRPVAEHNALQLRAALYGEKMAFIKLR